MRQFSRIGDRLEHVVHRLRDPRRDPEFQFHVHSPLESHHFMLYLYNMSIHDQFDTTFKALASPIRRQILDDLKDQPLTTGALCGHFARSEEHTSELQSLMRISYDVFDLT